MSFTLTDLPPELLSRIFVQSCNPAFRQASKYLYHTTEPRIVKVEFLVHKCGSADNVIAPRGSNRRCLKRGLTDDIMCLLVTLPQFRARICFETFLLAIESNMTEFVRLVLKESSFPHTRIRWDETDQDHFNVSSLLSSGLYKATRCNVQEMVSLFLNCQFSATPPVVPSESDSDSDSSSLALCRHHHLKIDISDSIHNCCRLGHAECLKLLLMANVEAEKLLKQRPRPHINHPLFVFNQDCLGLALRNSAARNHADCIRLLIDFGADPNQPSHDNDDTSPLSHASFRGHLECVRALLDAGARRGQFAMLMAVSQGHIPVVKLLIERLGVEMLEYEDHRPLRMATMQRNVVMTDTLLKLGAKAEVVHDLLTSSQEHHAADFLLSRYARIQD